MESIEHKIRTERIDDQSLSNALRRGRRDGFHPAFAPEIVGSRLQDRYWGRSYATQSIRATGCTKHGQKVDIYVHTEHWFSNPENILSAYRRDFNDLTLNGAARMPQEEFDRLIDLDEKTNEHGSRIVWVIDHGELWRARSKVMTTEEALEHPQTKPFIGDETKAELYLTKHKERYGDKIGVWRIDDFGTEPRARPLFFGSNHLGLDSAFTFFSDGRILAMKYINIQAQTSKKSLSLQDELAGTESRSAEPAASRYEQEQSTNLASGRKGGYTLEERERLRSLVAKRASLEQIASTLGRAMLSVYYELQRQSRNDQQLNTEVIKRYEQETEEYQQRLAGHYRNNSCSREEHWGKYYTPVELALLREDVEKGKSLSELSSTLKRPAACLVMKLRKLSQNNPELWKQEIFRKYQWELNHHM